MGPIRQWKRLMLASSILVTSCDATVDIVDATAEFTKSTESIFDHEVTLMSTDDESLTFHWNDVKGNSVEGRLIHRAGSMASAPSWLGFGIYDTFANNDPITPATPLMVGSDAIVGLVSTRSVLKYKLNGKIVSDPGGDGVYPATRQTLINGGILQHLGDDGTVTTDLSFEKLLDESDSEEVQIRHAGQNVFLWAMGAPGEESFSGHIARGALKLDLAKVQALAESGGSVIDNEGSEPGNNTGAEIPEFVSENNAPLVVGQCDSDFAETDMMVTLTPTLNFHWRLNTDVTPQSMTAIVEYTGEAWIGLGFSEDGKMIGSTAIIGLPAIEGLPAISELKDRTKSSIVPFTTQTLQHANITQENGKTLLFFTKILNEAVEGEVVISADGPNTFIYAIGKDNEFAYHEHRGSFQLDLSSCSSKTTTTSSSKMGIWIAHGVFAALAWAVASPFAITVAWFRTLVPSSWIYIHVFGHVFSFLFSFIAVIIAIVAMKSESFPNHFSDPHHWVGLFLLVGMMFQVMSGFLRPPVEKRDPYAASSDEDAWFTLPRNPRDVWHFAHRLAGVVMLAMGIFQVTSGLQMFSDKFGVDIMPYLSLVYYGLFGAVLLGLKLWILYEEYKARQGMAAIHAVDGRQGGEDSELEPTVQHDAQQM